MDDTRLEWLGQSLNAALCVPNDVYLDFLNTDRHEDRIDDFLNARLTTNAANKADASTITNLFFYATRENVTRQRDVEYTELEEIFSEDEDENAGRENDENQKNNEAEGGEANSEKAAAETADNEDEDKKSVKSSNSSLQKPSDTEIIEEEDTTPDIFEKVEINFEILNDEDFENKLEEIRKFQPGENPGDYFTTGNYEKNSETGKFMVEFQKKKPKPRRFKNVKKIRVEEYIAEEIKLFLSCGFMDNILRLLSLTESRTENGRSAKNTPIFYLSHIKDRFCYLLRFEPKLRCPT